MLMQRVLAGRVARRPVPFTAVLSAVIVTGTAHLPTGTGTVHLSLLEKFFPVTDADVLVQGDPPFKVPLVLVNRGKISAFYWHFDGWCCGIVISLALRMGIAVVASPLSAKNHKRN